MMLCLVNMRCLSGVKTMARAFISHPGSSRKSSMQNVERGHKECTQVHCRTSGIEKSNCSSLCIDCWIQDHSSLSST